MSWVIFVLGLISSVGALAAMVDSTSGPQSWIDFAAEVTPIVFGLVLVGMAVFS